jgi:uncharacterized Tic20 family protein
MSDSIIRPRDSGESLWSLACHFAAYAMFFFPFGNLIGPLIVWLAKRDRSPQIDEHGKSSLNFQLTMTIIFIGYTVLFAVFVFALVASGAIDLFKTERLDLLTLKIVALIGGVLISVMLWLLTAIYYWIMIAVNGIRAYDGKPAVYIPSISFLP